MYHFLYLGELFSLGDCLNGRGLFFGESTFKKRSFVCSTNCPTGGGGFFISHPRAGEKTKTGGFFFFAGWAETNHKGGGGYEGGGGLINP